ncbi:uncharacterized protein J4E84_011081 [Alternaria hordeiaustralica]|uniref:uncharacterized protein n=1 Tax=Alternaria hordeiaustralica TaxID=1187925 RepID=UPI0020C5A14A|nr:uncharacterized protein J4E84_011081 [Alternaria hordeiaustralica]KAI4673439.1 hypothetical protein J4E84_011081 [Alternaria hordeiaustralica]
MTIRVLRNLLVFHYAIYESFRIRRLRLHHPMFNFQKGLYPHPKYVTLAAVLGGQRLSSIKIGALGELRYLLLHPYQSSLQIPEWFRQLRKREFTFGFQYAKLIDVLRSGAS